MSARIDFDVISCSAEQMHRYIDFVAETNPDYSGFLSFHVGDRAVKMSGQWMTCEELHYAVKTAASCGGDRFTLWGAAR